MNKYFKSTIIHSFYNDEIKKKASISKGLLSKP